MQQRGEYVCIHYIRDNPVASKAVLMAFEVGACMSKAEVDL